MSSKSVFFRLIISFGLILCGCLFVFADTIRLKDGSVIKGKIVGFRAGQFLVVIGDGTRSRQMNFFADEIESIEFDSSDTQSNNANTSNPPSTALPRPTPSATPNNTDTRSGGGNGEPSVTSNPPPSVSNTATTPPNQNNQVNRPVSNPNQTNNPPIQNTSSRAKPIQLKVKVLADNTANGWTNAGWVVKKGQKN